MGYTTEFSGALESNKPFTPEILALCQSIWDDSDNAPGRNPGGYCQWVLRNYSDKSCLQWDGGEKFYDYIEWLQYLISKILSPEGYVFNGEIHWKGEDWSDLGKIVVKDNQIQTLKGQVTHSKERY